MAIQKSHPKSKLAKPRSSIFMLVASIACIGVLYLVSTLVSAPGSIQNGVRRPKNRHTLHEKYLYWGSRIDCPGKHCDSCAGLGHQESSLRCALEEALFLGRYVFFPPNLKSVFLGLNSFVSWSCRFCCEVLSLWASLSVH